jgi:glycosyl hydrolase family 15
MSRPPAGSNATGPACGAPGLLTEEYDITQRQVRGNAPQAFVHALLLESAQRLAAPWPSDTQDNRR